MLPELHKAAGVRLRVKMVEGGWRTGKVEDRLMVSKMEGEWMLNAVR